MSENGVQGLLNVSMEKIKEMVDVNTIIGQAITTPEGATIIPVSKVSYGFAAGGSDFSAKKPDADNLFGGGSGAGITITPVAFLTVNDGKVDLLQIQPCNNFIERIVEMVPSVVDKIGDIINTQKNKKETTSNKDKEVNPK